jgi:cytochrome d ubiquinol oxidase subunit II
VLGGTLAVGAAAYLAATYLCADARRQGHSKLAEAFRLRALATGLVLGVIAFGGVAVLYADAPRLFHGLTHQALALVVVSAVTGTGSLALLLRRHYIAVRITAVLTVTALLWGWAIAQYPVMLEPDITINDAAATSEVLSAVLIALGCGSVLLVPSLFWLYLIFQRERRIPVADEPSAPNEPVRVD